MKERRKKRKVFACIIALSYIVTSAKFCFVLWWWYLFDE